MDNISNIINEQEAIRAAEMIEKTGEYTPENITVSEDAPTVKESFEVVTNSGTNKGRTVKLSRPFEWEGRTYKEFTFDFDRLTGVDMIAIEDEMTALGQVAIDPTVSMAYMSKLAARAARVSVQTIENLPIADFSRIKNVVRDFLTRSGLAG